MLRPYRLDLPLVLKRCAMAAGLLALPIAAQAHLLGHHAPGGFASGVHHPISGLDHLLAMVAVGIWAAQLGKRAMWALPLTFPVVMIAGGALGYSGIALPGIEIGIALSVLILGVLVVARKRAPLGVATVLVALFALFHGCAHGAELPSGQSGLTYAMGFVAATAMLHAVGIGLGLLPKALKAVQLERVAGAAVAVAGCYFLWSAMA